jgi:hypothetical protein
MSRLLFSALIFSVIATVPVLAQRKTQEVIYLKNGSVIRNVYDMQHADSLIRVTTREGSVFVFGPGDIQKMSREFGLRLYKEKGYLFEFDFGILSGRESIRNSFGFNTYQGAVTSFSFAVVNGYRFNRFAGVGLGVGIDGYQEGVITPLFVRGTGYLLKARISPVYVLDAGYGFYSPVLNGRTDNRNGMTFHYRGGFMGNAAGGVQVFLGRDVALYMMAGYRMQDYRYEINSERTESSLDQRILFRRMSLRMGFSF